MPKTDKRVDAYIARAQPFAQPILVHLRSVMHEACPEVEETIKWGMPHFAYHGNLAGMSAFKAHAAFGFWKGELVTGKLPGATKAMWGFGKLTTVRDLPSKRTLVGYVKKAMQLNEAGVTKPRPVKRTKVALATPAELATALRRNARARKTWDTLSPGKRRDFIEWITGAKRAETKERRLAAAIELLEEGKSLNWKYEKR